MELFLLALQYIQYTEIANCLDTDSFINVLKSVIARHGSPQEIRSENGSTCNGGEREIHNSIPSMES